MEKSIEQIWEQGFLHEEHNLAPRINKLYDQKSIHIIDKFQRMFRLNILLIVAAACILLLVSIFLGTPIAGTVLFIALGIVANTAYRDLTTLNELNKGNSSYVYLTTFQAWVESSIEKYGKLYKVIYPTIILSVYFGIWFSSPLEPIRELAYENSKDFIFGLHSYTTIIVILGALFMSVFSKQIHRKDVELLYGKILLKLNETINDMKELVN